MTIPEKCAIIIFELKRFKAQINKRGGDGRENTGSRLRLEKNLNLKERR